VKNIKLTVEMSDADATVTLHQSEIRVEDGDYSRDMARLIAFDFDGVIHRYSKGWQGEANIYDVPVKGIDDAMRDLILHGFDICIYSSRAKTDAGMKAITDWLADYSMDGLVSFVSHEKPPARCYIDDRAILFTGDAAKILTACEEFKSWVE
jgi:hypothetical protein